MEVMEEVLGTEVLVPEEEEMVEEASIPEEEITNKFLKRSVDLYSSTLWMAPELNTTPAFNFPQLYLTNLLKHRRQC